MASDTKLMTSGASIQNRVQPIMRPVCALTMAFIIPSICCKVRARGMAAARQPGHLKRITAFYGFLFGHADMRQRRICKNDIWNRNPVIGLSLFIAE